MPLLTDCAHSPSTVKHSIEQIISATHRLNPGQVPVVTMDQPLFAIAKQLQWQYPEEIGEDKLVVVMGGLHIEQAVLKVLGDFLSGSGWTNVLSNSGNTCIFIIL